MAEGYCPDCDATVDVGGNPKKGQTLTCGSCGADLQVKSISPVELDWAYEDDEVEAEFEYDDEDFDEDFDD
ncbi:MAG: hypothetical protein WBR18_10705 [Anaerolineales bacterium]